MVVGALIFVLGIDLVKEVCLRGREFQMKLTWTLTGRMGYPASCEQNGVYYYLGYHYWNDSVSRSS